MCGFRKGYSTKYALINLIGQWRECISNKGIVGTVLMDLSKAYDCLPHDLIIAKLEAYGLSYNGLQLMMCYLNNRFQPVRINNTYSNWMGVISGIPQGSVLGPLLFNIYINDLFYIIDNICNFADDNTLSSCNYSIELVCESLECQLKNVLIWLKTNYLSANFSKL